MSTGTDKLIYTYTIQAMPHCIHYMHQLCKLLAENEYKNRYANRLNLVTIETYPFFFKISVGSCHKSRNFSHNSFFPFTLLSNNFFSLISMKCIYFIECKPFCNQVLLVLVSSLFLFYVSKLITFLWIRQCGVTFTWSLWSSDFVCTECIWRSSGIRLITLSSQIWDIQANQKNLLTLWITPLYQIGHTYWKLMNFFFKLGLCT